MTAAIAGATILATRPAGAVPQVDGIGVKSSVLSRSARSIDVHAHFIPDDYRQAAIAAGHEHPDGMPALPPWREADMLEVMDRVGIETAILSISSPGVHFGDDVAARALARAVNRMASTLKAAKPSRFGFFASLPLPDVGASLSELAYALDTLGADGVVIESNSNGIYPGNPEFEFLFAELDRRSAVVFLHPTSPHCPCCFKTGRSLPGPVLEFMFETTRAIADLVLSGTLDRYRNIRLIVPHAGAAVPVLADRIAMAAGMLPDMGHVTPQDILETLGRLYYDLAGAPVPRLLPALRTLAAPSHLLYGSDWPFTPEAAVSKLRGQLETFVQNDPALLDAIRRGNAERLFPRLG